MVVHAAKRGDGSYEIRLEDAGIVMPISMCGGIEKLIEARLNGETRGSFRASLDKHGTLEVGDRIRVGGPMIWPLMYLAIASLVFVFAPPEGSGERQDSAPPVAWAIFWPLLILFLIVWPILALRAAREKWSERRRGGAR